MPKAKVRKTIDFDEVTGWQAFEDLVADYFRKTATAKGITSVVVQPSGVGADGGRDILVTIQLFDSISPFERKWIVQCKFYSKAVSKTELSSVNIPTLIHEYGADGYLLVCNGGVTSGVTTMFENLRANCKMGYRYEIWTGSEFANNLYLVPPKPLLQKYFPEYFHFIQSRKGASKL